MAPSSRVSPTLDRVGSDDGSSTWDNGSDHEAAPMIEKTDGDVVSRNNRKVNENKNRTPIYILGGLLLASLLGNAVLLTSYLTHKPSDSLDMDAICVNHTSEYWSPIMDGVKVRYESVLFDGSFMNKSIYQQEAGPEVDEAWSGLGIDCEFHQDSLKTPPPKNNSLKKY